MKQIAVRDEFNLPWKLVVFDVDYVPMPVAIGAEPLLEWTGWPDKLFIELAFC